MGEKTLLVIQMGDSIRRGENDTHFLDISQHRGNVAIAVDTQLDMWSASSKMAWASWKALYQKHQRLFVDHTVLNHIVKVPIAQGDQPVVQVFIGLKYS